MLSFVLVLFFKLLSFVGRSLQLTCFLPDDLGADLHLGVEGLEELLFQVFELFRGNVRSPFDLDLQGRDHKRGLFGQDDAELPGYPRGEGFEKAGNGRKDNQTKKLENKISHLQAKLANGPHAGSDEVHSAKFHAIVRTSTETPGDADTIHVKATRRAKR